MGPSSLRRTNDTEYRGAQAGFGFADSLGDAIEDVDVEEDEVPEVVECRAKKGEIWQLGAHRIMCGDSTCREDVEKLAGGGSATYS